MNAAYPLGDLGGGMGFGEVLLIFAVVLVMFGPRKLPEVARLIGRTLEQLRRASQDFKDQIMRLDETPPATPPVSATPGVWSGPVTPTVELPAPVASAPPAEAVSAPDHETTPDQIADPDQASPAG
jgi:TatA/E family protein of Tat protein translocase